MHVCVQPLRAPHVRCASGPPTERRSGRPSGLVHRLVPNSRASTHTGATGHANGGDKALQSWRGSHRWTGIADMYEDAMCVEMPAKPDSSKVGGFLPLRAHLPSKLVPHQAVFSLNGYDMHKAWVDGPVERDSVRAACQKIGMKPVCDHVACACAVCGERLTCSRLRRPLHRRDQDLSPFFTPESRGEAAFNPQRQTSTHILVLVCAHPLPLNTTAGTLQTQTTRRLSSRLVEAMHGPVVNWVRDVGRCWAHAMQVASLGAQSLVR